MAGGQERTLRRRIRSVQSTKKITKAMELIAASQIVRSLGRMTANRPYRAGVARIVVEAAKGDPAAAAKLLGAPEQRERVAVLAIVADRGLSGPYNSSVLRATERLVAKLQGDGVAVRLFSVGRKAQSYFRFRHQPVERAFTGVSERPSFSDARTVAAVLSAPFLAGEVDQVLLVSTRYKSAGSQVVEIHQLLPLPEPGSAPLTGEAAGATRAPSGPSATPQASGESTWTGTEGRAAAGTPPPRRAGAPGSSDGGGGTGTGAASGASSGAAAGAAVPAHGTSAAGYTEFEPDVQTLLARLAPRAVESEIFTALLEGASSFFTAQQRAMAAASDNADELIRTLTRVMNRARQDAITTEIMEIVGGAEALRQSKGA